jgi:hypothetical protein
MTAIWIGIFFFIQAIVLFFALTLGKSAARADIEFVRAHIIEQRSGLITVDRIEGIDHQISPDTKPASRLNNPIRISN